MKNTELIEAPPLPLTRQEWESRRKREANLIDLLEQVFLARIGDGEDGQEFLRYVSAVCNQNAVEKSMKADDWVASMLLRDYSRESRVNQNEVGKADLTAIHRALPHVLRRFDLSRNQRREEAIKLVTEGAGRVSAEVGPEGQ